jgi:hypothetical protein
MLWYKGWFETRFKIIVALGFGLFFVFTLRNANAMSTAALEGSISVLAFYWALMPFLLAGAGIRTQASFGPNKGLHGSTYFTLSMPVSRLRLLAVRSALGMLEMAGVVACLCFVVWSAVPAFRADFTGLDMLAYWAAVCVCTSGFYFMSVLLATFFEEPWSIWASMLAVGLLRWLLPKVSALPSVDLFQAMGKSSPLFTHTFPWASMGISLSAAAVLFFTAMRVVQTHEY